MKKEGTGNPRNPDIALDADVRMRELHFEEVPEPEVFFRGNTARNSVWESRRENLPDEVQEGVIYRSAEVRLRIATEMVNSDRGSWSSSYSERVKTELEYSERTTGKQRPESKGEKK